MTTEEKRLAHNQKVREWRLSNPEKHKATQKKQDSRPERLESKRKRMAEWRKNNPDKQKEIANRSYRNCFEKNRDKDNERARKQWLNEEYREKRLKKMAQTRQENRDLFCVDCGKELPKHKSKYCEYCKDKNYKIKVEEWRIKAGNKYINELQNKRVKKKVDMLTDGYVAALLRSSKLTGLKLQEMPKELIELKRNVLKIKRIAKNENYETSTNL